MDIRTLSSLSVAIILGFGLALGLFSRLDPRGRGPRCFAAAFGCIAMGVLLIGLRGLASEFVTVIGGNFLVGVGFVGLWRGARCLGDSAACPFTEAGILGLFVAGMAYWTYVHPDVRVRVVVFSLMTMATSMLALRDSLRFARASRGRGGGILVVVFAVFTAYSAVRAAATPLEGRIPDFMHAGNFQATAFLVLMFGTAALAFAVVWTTLAGMTDELAAANLRLARSNEQLERFARVVSHDLRDPLATARGYADLLLGRHRDELAERPRTYVEEIGAAMDRCMRLIDDVLFLSRLKSDGRDLERVSLGDACAEAIENLRGTVDRSGASIRVADLPEISGSRVQIVRLFQNLIGNSIRYRHPERQPDIRIEAAPDRAAWRVAVADNGLGFDAAAGEEHLAAPRHGSAHPESTGLGLSICRQIVENHGGGLWVKSAPGAGTTVFFTVGSEVPRG